MCRWEEPKSGIGFIWKCASDNWSLIALPGFESKKMIAWLDMTWRDNFAIGKETGEKLALRAHGPSVQGL